MFRLRVCFVSIEIYSRQTNVAFQRLVKDNTVCTSVVEITEAMLDFDLVRRHQFTRIAAIYISPVASQPLLGPSFAAGIVQQLTQNAVSWLRNLG